jgi:hypothetical protein
MMVRTSVQLLALYPHHSPWAAAQPRIDEVTLVAVQHQMAQQAAFSQIPDAVKRVRPVWQKKSDSYHSTDNLNTFFLLVYRSLPPSSFGKQPRRDNDFLRQRLEPTHGKVLCKN